MSFIEQIWIVDDDSSIRWVMEKALTRAGLDCRAFESADDVLTALSSEEPMVVVSDIRMPGMDGIQLLAQIRTQQPDLPVIITTAHSDLDSAVNAYEEGAFEYLPKPFDINEMVSTVARAQAQRNPQLKPSEKSTESRTAEIIGNAPAMQEVFRAIGRLAQVISRFSSMASQAREKSWSLVHSIGIVLGLTMPLSRSIWPPSLKSSWSRSYLDMRKGHLQAPIIVVRVDSNKLAEELCFSMKSATCLRPPKLVC